jgi:hypothetical protein
VIDHAQPPGVYAYLQMNNTAVISGVLVRARTRMGNAINARYVTTRPVAARAVADYINLAANHIADMARRFGATVTPTWQLRYNCCTSTA